MCCYLRYLSQRRQATPSIPYSAKRDAGPYDRGQSGDIHACGCGGGSIVLSNTLLLLLYDVVRIHEETRHEYNDVDVHR